MGVRWQERSGEVFCVFFWSAAGLSRPAAGRLLSGPAAMRDAGRVAAPSRRRHVASSAAGLSRPAAGRLLSGPAAMRDAGRVAAPSRRRHVASSAAGLSRPRAAFWAGRLLFVDAPSRIDRTMAPDSVLAIRHATLGASRRRPAAGGHPLLTSPAMASQRSLREVALERTFSLYFTHFALWLALLLPVIATGAVIFLAVRSAITGTLGPGARADLLQAAMAG